MTEWQYSSTKMTVWLTEDNSVITDAAPIVRKFIGQPAFGLERWMRSHGSGFRKSIINGKSIYDWFIE